MAYEKRTWVSGTTPLSAENMNHMEAGIAAANEGVDKLNTDITHVMMPDYSKQVQVTSPYTAESDGWLQCNLRSQGGLSTLRIDGSTAFAIGQTISSSSYTTNFITVPIAKGQTAVVDGIVVSIYFVPCIGI